MTLQYVRSSLFLKTNVSVVHCILHLNTLCFKNVSFLFLNNSVKYQPILIRFVTQYSEETR